MRCWNLPEPANVKQARNALGVLPVRLDRHGLQGTLKLSGFYQDDIQICRGQLMV